MCTIQSFKGWELDNVVIVWPSRDELAHIPKAERDALFYTAVSRGMTNVVVLNANRDYDQFFGDWEKYSKEDQSNGEA